jgi:hypothetical protein
MDHYHQGSIYSVTFSDLECSGVAERDVFEITGSTDTRFRLHSVEMSQHAGNIVGASAESLKVEILVGATKDAAGGDSAVPRRYEDQGATALCTVSVNSTTVGGNAGSEVLRYADAWHLNEKYVYRPPIHERIQVGLSVASDNEQRLSVRLEHPAAGIALNGTIVWEEIGKKPSES